jgi:hypothetical protein
LVGTGETSAGPVTESFLLLFYKKEALASPSLDPTRNPRNDAR